MHFMELIIVITCKQRLYGKQLLNGYKVVLVSMAHIKMGTVFPFGMKKNVLKLGNGTCALGKGLS